MTLSQAVMHVFDPGVRRRGEAYVHSRIRDLTVHGDIVSADVTGSAHYGVNILFYPEIPAVEWYCSCPFFEDKGPHDPCKHLWAVMRRAENEGGLRIDPGLAENIRIVESDALDADGNWPEFDDDDDDLPFTSPLPPQSKWRQLMTSVVFADEHAPRIAPPITSEILYLVDVPATFENRGLTLQVLHRREKKSGGWTRPRAFDLEPHLLATLPDPRDRQIMALLHGAGEDASYYRQAYGSRRVFRLSATLAPLVLVQMAATGRLVLFRHQRDLDVLPRLRHDDAPPWRFTLDVRKDEARACFTIEGSLTRNDAHLPLTEPILLVREGWIFMRESFAQLDHGGMFSWLAALRREGKVDIPFAEADEWLMALLNAPRIPSIDLPPELQYTTIDRRPKPVLRVVKPRHADAGSYLGGTLSFDYMDAKCGLKDGNQRWFDAERRLLLRRDAAAEQSLVERLLETGFRHPRQGHDYSYKEMIHFEVTTRKFANALRTLIAEGWQVEASGKKCRTGGQIAIHVRSDIDWFEVEGQADFDGVSVPFPTILAALKHGETTLLLDDGTLGVIPEQWLKRFAPLAGAATVKKENARFSRSQLTLLDALLSAEAQVSCDEVFQRLRDELHAFSAIEPAEAPPGFVGTLRGYQREGLGWLQFLRRFGFGGCLADDMGLGKTVQALALLERCRDDACGASLVVVPRSLVLNWMQEAERFAPQLKTLNHSGNDRARTTTDFTRYDLVLTTYGILRRDVAFLREFEFEHIILDEAQAIKNPGTASAKAARLLRGRHRLAVSGTPIENHLGELWSLFEFLNPGMLGTASVFKTITAGTGDEINAEMRGLLARALRPFILRRTKQQVAADLPEKTEETIYCELQPTQRKLYNELRDYYRRSLLAKVDATGLNKAKIMVLEALLRLRQAACHPGLLDPKKSHHASAKLDLLLGQLEDVVAEGHKVLVFSQFTSMLAIVRSRLDARKICYEYLDGKTSNRAERVERFQTDGACGVFLISLKAGGLGLNLTAADYVVLLDPWWNPAVEAQAIDRAHRIGQTRPVFAYRLVAKDTVEEHILELQNTKKDLADSIITADNSLIRDLNREDLELLLT